jgi:chromosome segregation ATPase
MKKQSSVLAAGLAALLLGLPGCVAKSKYEESQKQNEQLKQETETLKGQVESVGALNTEAQATLDEVQKSLEELRAKELKAVRTSIAVAQEGKASGKREELKAEIAEIRKAVQANLEKLATVTRQRNEAAKKAGVLGARVTALEKLVAELKSSLEEKEAMLVELEQKVLQLQKTTEELKQTVAEKEAEVVDTQQKLATAYVVVGTKKELEKAGLIEKKGSILGLGGSWKQTGKFDEKLFRKIDVRTETEVTFPAPPDKIRILTEHPKGSFELTTQPPSWTKLKILDAAAFWKGSRYLIVLIPG